MTLKIITRRILFTRKCRKATKALADNDRNLHSVAILNSTRLEGLGRKLLVSTPLAAIVRVAQLSRRVAMHTCSVLRVRFPHLHEVFFVIFIYFFLIFSRLLRLELGSLGLGLSG